MNENMEKIKRITQAIETSNNLLDFDNIELPFQLLNAVICLLDQTFSDVTLNTLEIQDSETLDAWAIALHESLPNQLALLNRWQNYLNNLSEDASIPRKLLEKIDEKMREIELISAEKSQLTLQYEQLFQQEETLRENKRQLTDLQIKLQELNSIEKELNRIDLAQLQEEVRIKQETITPKTEQLNKLKQEKNEVESTLKELKKLEEQLQIDNELIKLSQGKIENKSIQITRELIEQIQLKRNNLSENLTNILEELTQQQTEYQSIKDKLNNAVQNFNQYQIKTQEIKYHLETHYQYNSELISFLPVDRTETDNIIREIKDKLDKLDRELTKAHKNHEISQQKLNITF